jgi:hypothetical protein
MTRCEILASHGIVDRLDMIVRVIKESSAPWRVGIHGRGDPFRPLDTDRALKLSEDLRRIGEASLASRIEMEIERAHRYNNTAGIRTDAESRGGQGGLRG